MILEIVYLIPGAGMPSDEIERRAKVANSIANSDTNISVVEVGEGPLSIESSIEEHMAIGPMLRKMRDIHSDYDALIIGCAGDPGLRPSRELLDIPVIGPAESAYHFACMISDRFSVLSTLQAGVESDGDLRSHLREMGLESHFVSVEFVGLSVVELWGAKNDVLTKELETAMARAKAKGAGSIVLGCMSMAFLLVDEVFESDEIRIVNPLKTAIKTAEMFVDLKAKHSRLTYPGADVEKLDQTIFKNE